jgi:hypothetical protein
MKIITLAFLLLTSFSLSASTLTDVQAYKFTDSLDDSFFQDCLDTMEPGEGMLKCRVFQAPEGLKVLKDGGLFVAFNFIVLWSQTHCSINQRDNGVLYIKRTSTYADIYFHDVRCIENIRDAVLDNQSGNFKNKSVYLIAQ